MKTILERFENTVARFPKKTAVAFGEEAYSFSELLQLSKQLACAVDSAYKNKPIAVFCGRNALCICQGKVDT
jgi:non-ribosomal peptide synthetase component E (peptide arylation enzyme)